VIWRPSRVVNRCWLITVVIAVVVCSFANGIGRGSTLSASPSSERSAIRAGAVPADTHPIRSLLDSLIGSVIQINFVGTYFTSGGVNGCEGYDQLYGGSAGQIYGGTNGITYTGSTMTGGWTTGKSSANNIGVMWRSGTSLAYSGTPVNLETPTGQKAYLSFQDTTPSTSCPLPTEALQQTAIGHAYSVRGFFASSRPRALFGARVCGFMSISPAIDEIASTTPITERILITACSNRDVPHGTARNTAHGSA